jgi:Tol biopolymer transport system component
MWLLEGSFADVRDIDYSPDGTQIMVQDQGGARMQVMNADGSDLHLLLKGEDACCAATWSPTGDRIGYQLSAANGPSSSDSEVWTVAPDGSNAIKVFDSGGCDMGATADALPVWAPNGTQVAYNACGTWVVANADGTGEPQPIDEPVCRSWAGGGLSGWGLF